MKTMRSRAAQRLFKKLSALRATLSNEERVILDNLIVDEVAAHSMTTKSVGKASNRAANKAEVAAHSMTSKAVNKAIGKASGKAINKAEAAAHSMTTRVVNKAIGKSSNKAEVAAHSMTTKATDKVRIAFDPTSEEYKVQD